MANLDRAGELIQSFKQVAVDQAILEHRTFRVKKYLEEVLASLEPFNSMGYRKFCPLENRLTYIFVRCCYREASGALQ